MTTLVIGARGSVGSAVLAGLLAAGEPVRASSRDPRPGDFPDGVGAVRGDLADPATFGDLLRGVQAVFLYADEHEPEAFATAMRDAGVRHAVLLSSHSVLTAGAAHNPVARLHARAERALRASGVASTFIRPGYFATNTLRWTTIRTDRVLRTAFPDGRMSPVDERDIADVAVAALRDPALRGRALLVPGPGPITLREQVADIAAAIGEDVRVERVTVDEYREELVRQVPPALADRLIAARGDVPQVPLAVRADAVRLVLGREPRPYAEWARAHAAGFR